jgi:outer membrane receptor for ferrienterochelin and colicins
MLKKLLSFLATVSISMVALAQDVTVSGNVSDANGNAISGALVMEKGTTNAVKTKSDGTYSITIPANRLPATVMVRSVGYGSTETAVDGTESAVNFSPSIGSNTKQLNEVVVSASKKSEKILNAPASVSILSEARIQQNTALSVIDNVRRIAAVDAMPTGLVSNNMVIRGFNNIFSGATLYMVDNRIASVPSLRVNAFQLVPTANTDIRSMELVRGPASALYGPFAANGVMAVYTKSPLDMENRMEVTLGLTSGVRAGDDDNAAFGFKANNNLENLGILNPEIRIAGKLSKTLGIKVSGNYMSGSDFAFFDAREPNGKNVRFGNQAAGTPWASDGSAPITFNRDFRIRKLAGDARIDWRPAVNTEFNFSTGYANNTNVELTGLGGAQAVGWTSNYFQAQFKKDRFYAQYFVNMTNSGNTFLIPQNANQTTFTYLKETSELHSAQVQHSSQLANKKLNLVYGADLFMTRPSGNVYGRFDGIADINQYGGYLQGDYKFNKQWSFTGAFRVDYQDAINETMFSPRAALVYKPKDNHTLRLTYNRAFSAPTALNFFLDVNNGLLPTGQNVRAFGNATGIQYDMGTFGGASSPLITLANGANMPYNQFIAGNVARSSAMAALTSSLNGKLPAAAIPSTVSLLFNGINPDVQLKDLVNNTVMDVNGISNKESVKSTVTQTFEAGYKGFIMDKLSVGIDLYYTRIENFSSPLTMSTFNTQFNPAYFANPAVQAQMVSNVLLTPMPASSRAQLLALLTGKTNPTNAEIVTGYATLIGQLGTLAGGVIAPDNTNTQRDIILTYLNLGTVDVAGADLNFSYMASKLLNIEGAFSFVNKDRIPLLGAAGGFVSLNAPQYKSALSLDYKMPFDNNLSARVGWRWMDKFDANSAVYIGRVNAMNMVDLGLSYRLKSSQNTVFSLTVNNVFDHRHQFFPLTSAIGRVAFLFKVLHTFGVK